MSRTSWCDRTDDSWSGSPAGDAWQVRTDQVTDAAALADLPSAALAADTDERAKRCDLLVLRAQLGVIATDPGFAAARDRIRAIAALGEQRSIPAVARHLAALPVPPHDEAELAFGF